MPRVFVPQVPSRFDTDMNQWVPMVDISPANKYGDIFVMLPPEASRLRPANLVKQLRAAMQDYSENDFILAIGDPVCIAIVAALANRACSPMRMLKWDHRMRDYTLSSIDINEQA